MLRGGACTRVRSAEVWQPRVLPAAPRPGVLARQMPTHSCFLLPPTLTSRRTSTTRWPSSWRPRACPRPRWRWPQTQVRQRGLRVGWGAGRQAGEAEAAGRHTPARSSASVSEAARHVCVLPQITIPLPKRQPNTPHHIHPPQTTCLSWRCRWACWTWRWSWLASRVRTLLVPPLLPVPWMDSWKGPSMPCGQGDYPWLSHMPRTPAASCALPRLPYPRLALCTVRRQ